MFKNINKESIDNLLPYSTNIKKSRVEFSLAKKGGIIKKIVRNYSTKL